MTRRKRDMLVLYEVNMNYYSRKNAEEYVASLSDEQVEKEYYDLCAPTDWWANDDD